MCLCPGQERLPRTIYAPETQTYLSAAPSAGDRKSSLCGWGLIRKWLVWGLPRDREQWFKLSYLTDRQKTWKEVNEGLWILYSCSGFSVICNEPSLFILLDLVNRYIHPECLWGPGHRAKRQRELQHTPLERDLKSSMTIHWCLPLFSISYHIRLTQQKVSVRWPLNTQEQTACKQHDPKPSSSLSVFSPCVCYDPVMPSHIQKSTIGWTRKTQGYTFFFF